jgi:hypothetical protein
LLPEADQAGGNAAGGDGLFTAMHVAGEVHLNVTGEVKTTLDGRLDDGEFFEANHLTSLAQY